ncbi:hypothetical protein HII28_19300 [Planctomonas sp. JC2975]|uniref:hypothetical protein n=1 Tax=Planctomonas sp. JC2975 TaxID=2729626 RepID=UPI0014742B65|nr:hypothetical protein [Planctomonas sp. JC2975]NNC14014.1 hypothetical protein [Planctomonas sp. JC2975]
MTVEGDSLSRVAELINAQVPDGWVFSHMETEQSTNGVVVAVGHLRSLETREIDVEGDEYGAAYTALRAMVPEGWQLVATGPR